MSEPEDSLMPEAEAFMLDAGSKREREVRCGGTGLVSYWDGGAYVG